jgi:hypothetical protein
VDERAARHYRAIPAGCSASTASATEVRREIGPGLRVDALLA